MAIGGIDKQGRHIDPMAPTTSQPDPATWSAVRRDAFLSKSMDLLRASLRLDGVGDVRTSVLDDLATFHGLGTTECLERCLGWEAMSVQEWQKKDRTSQEGLRDFYRSTESWSFDLLWFAYLQTEGHAYPAFVLVAEALKAAGARPGRHLDFGSGVGALSQLISRLGYETDLADVSTTLLAFAKFRLERHGDRANFIDLNVATLEENRYDVITATDTLAHVPDFAQTARMLHKALKPGGLLFANFDTRPPSPENAWHLYADDLPLRWQLHRIGFEPIRTIEGVTIVYRRIEPAGVRHIVHAGRDYLLFRSPLRPTYRLLKSIVRRRREAPPSTERQL
jgi:SAM-dependent methyltransferase